MLVFISQFNENGNKLYLMKKKLTMVYDKGVLKRKSKNE